MRLIYYIFLASFIVNFALIFVDSNYNYDETVVTHISTQPLGQMFDTVKAEPHPPGLYLLLKIFPTQNKTLSKVVQIFTGYALVLLALLTWKQWIKKLAFIKFGVALFLGSYTFQEIMGNLKQDFVSFPFFLIFLGILIHPKISSKKKFIYANICAFMVLFFGYINYFLLIYFVFLLFAVSQKRKLLGLILLLQGLTFILWSKVWLIEQLRNNSKRFGWAQLYTNTFWNNLNGHLVGFNVGDLSHKIIVSTYLILIAISFMRIKKILKNKNLKYYYLFSLSLIPPLLLMKHEQMLTRVRYTSVLQLGVSILAGSGLCWMWKYFNKFIAYLLLVIFIFFGMSANIIASTYTRVAKNTFDEIILNFSKSAKQPVAYISDYGLYPLVYQLSKNTNNKIVPINPNIGKLYLPITKEELILNEQLATSPDLLRDALYEDNISSVIYFKVNPKEDTEDDYLGFRFLSDKCKLNKIERLTAIYSVYFFEKCNYEGE